jgi:uncharacterized membrane protein YfcA
MQGADRQQENGRPDGRGDAAQLVGIGSGAGLFSSLFGVGGGTVLVPLLVFWRGFNEKKATGTSLLAITVIAGYAVASYGVFGHVDVTKGVLIGLPAIFGVVFGTWLQQRITDRVLSGMFSLLMVVVIVLYLVR